MRRSLLAAALLLVVLASGAIASTTSAAPRPAATGHLIRLGTTTDEPETDGVRLVWRETSRTLRGWIPGARTHVDARIDRGCTFAHVSDGGPSGDSVAGITCERRAGEEPGYLVALSNGRRIRLPRSAILPGHVAGKIEAVGRQWVYVIPRGDSGESRFVNWRTGATYVPTSADYRFRFGLDRRRLLRVPAPKRLGTTRELVGREGPLTAWTVDARLGGERLLVDRGQRRRFAATCAGVCWLADLWSGKLTWVDAHDDSKVRDTLIEVDLRRHRSWRWTLPPSYFNDSPDALRIGRQLIVIGQRSISDYPIYQAIH